MMMRLISPRSTAPYQTLESSSRITSPSTVAPGTTHALEWMVGPFCSRGTIPSRPVGNESGSICIRDGNQDGTRSVRTQGYGRARLKELRALRKTHYKVVIKGLLRWEHSTLIADMPSKITLALGTALTGIALCCFIESSLAQDALDASLAATENDERDAEDKDDKDEKSGRRRTRTKGRPSSGSSTWRSDN